MKVHNRDMSVCAVAIVLVFHPYMEMHTCAQNYAEDIGAGYEDLKVFSSRG